MNAALAAKFDILEDKFQALQADNIKFYYGLGEIVREIKADPGKYVGSDGTPAMDLIEDALVTQARTLRKCASFAECYTPHEMEDLTLLRNTTTGFTLHWGHVSYLLTLTNKPDRAKYAHDAVARMWDPAMLHERIKKATGRAGGHGRTHELPATVEKQARQIRDLTRTWLLKQQQVWNGPEVNVFTNILNAGPKQVTAELRDYLFESREMMADLADAARQNETHFAETLHYVDTILAEKAAAIVSKQAKGATPHREIEMAAAG